MPPTSFSSLSVDKFFIVLLNTFIRLRLGRVVQCVLESGCRDSYSVAEFPLHVLQDEGDSHEGEGSLTMKAAV